MLWKEFKKNVTEVKEKRTSEVLDLLNDSLGTLIFERDNDGNIDRKCKLCANGQLSLKNSFRGGAFIGCSNYPECKFTRPLSKAKAAQQSQLAEPKLIGKHENGNDMYLKVGRFGPYIQYEKIPEIVDEGKTCYYVEPSTNAFAKAIKAFYEEDNISELNSTISDYKSKFSWDNMVNAIEELVNVH